ncbi:hypothetical protein LEL86_24850 [Streptomyces sp. WA6-1-16]|uniref:hypothetical protein n=1 Tax=Streptomyces sp. WA6-1-16 TaxID=2879427 RepID=UPI001CE35159|nr:hypothetical protein [Streptomyces sp. WA6-1-16]UCA52325.1 hypothetical protein LEL86_24850 [Streptomyces sp. WA6-1-16]
MYAVVGLLLLAVHLIRPRTAGRAVVVLTLLTAAGYLLLAWVLAITGGGGIDTAAATEQGRQAAYLGQSFVLALVLIGYGTALVGHHPSAGHGHASAHGHRMIFVCSRRPMITR